MLLTALAVAALGFMVFGFGTSLPVLLSCAIAIGAGQGVGAPVSNTVLYEASPPERVSEAMGLRTSLGMATHTALPLFIGAAGSFVGIAPILLVMGMLLLFSVWLLRDKWRVAG